MSATQQPQRQYTGKDVEMLTAIATIAQSATTYKTDLQAERSNWADPFFQTLIEDINRTAQQ